MKSALANIGKKELSAVALKLEKMGREGHTDFIKTDTPEFLQKMHELIEGVCHSMKHDIHQTHLIKKENCLM
jgi:HPt (histidine-containing phosphotransfer) domain-containing protein